MRYKNPSLYLVLLIAASVCIAEILSPIALAISTDQLDQVLGRYRVAVRVYKDPAAGPASYQLVYVQADGLSIRLDAVKAAAPDIKDGSVRQAGPLVAYRHGREGHASFGTVCYRRSGCCVRPSADTQVGSA
ncbi:MAG: hypothetical protein QHH07_10350 [Sedimentisphaerales bacterium]|nr:hypothetical protein [Sedimentisphaerales bacterium]